MAQDDLVGMENVAPEHWERKISTLKVGVGAMPGKPLQEVKEGEEDELISGRGCVP